jgi:lipoprotein-anchoring transpeptidase ErfK/SrfK
MPKRSAFSIAGLIMAMAITTPPSSIAAEPPVVRPSQELAMLVEAHTAVSTPGRSSARRAVSSSRPITGEQTALPVLGRAVTPEGVAWLLVMLPGRPNGTRGWIEQRGTQRRTTSWRVVVKTASRRLLVYRRGLLVRTFPAVVGKPSTPTPHGVFFVEESVLMPAGSAGGPFGLALSAHSDVLRTFEGGTGQIAIHGVAKLSGAVGTASSHGCVRLADRDIRWMAAHIAPGVPVEIVS